MTDPIRLALLGHPVSHSRSPAIHAAALAATGMVGDYRAIDADEARLGQAIQELRTGSLTGINVTMPLKAKAAEMADELTPLAARARSVNTLRSRDGLVEAHTTDAVAFEELLADARFGGDAPILVLGSGDTARAALAVVGSRETYVSSRSGDKVVALMAEYGFTGSIPWGQGLAGAIVVNTTPLGMRGEHLPDAVEDALRGLIDLPYGDEATPAAVRAASSGTPVADGVEFLARQAGAAFTWWTGQDVDFEALVEVARNV